MRSGSACWISACGESDVLQSAIAQFALKLREGTRRVSRDDRGNLHVWHISLGELIRVFQTVHHNPARNLAVSPDGHRLALRLDNGQVGLLDICRR